MRENDYPAPVSDPEAEGLPETADDDSTAWDDVESGREADGPDPASLPVDEALGMNRFGTTAAEQRQGEGLDAKVAREAPETPVDDPFAAPGALADEAIDEDAARQAATDADVLDESPIEPRTESAVSMYDAKPAGESVGRLVEEDRREGTAYDAGADSGGASAEERAMHVEEER
jgi:hypothetical protein